MYEMSYQSQTIAAITPMFIIWYEMIYIVMFIRLKYNRIETMWSIFTIESSRDVIKANQLLQSSPANQPIVVMPFLAKIIHIGAIAILKIKYIFL